MADDITKLIDELNKEVDLYERQQDISIQKGG